MSLAALAFAAGAALLQLQAVLPALAWALVVPVLLLAGLRYRALLIAVGSSRVDLQACKLEYSIVSPK